MYGIENDILRKDVYAGVCDANRDVQKITRRQNVALRHRVEPWPCVGIVGIVGMSPSVFVRTRQRRDMVGSTKSRLERHMWTRGLVHVGAVPCYLPP